MSKLINLVDKNYGRLLVVKRNPENIGKHSARICKCDCGSAKTVRGDHLRNGLIRSCGCLEVENRNEGANFIHGGSKTRLYSIWCGMHKRCNNQNTRAYSNYGGRGIGVCDSWSDFEKFRDWALSNGYSDSLSIDRINNDGNYEPSNCRWATPMVQANNRRKRRIPSGINPKEYRGE